MFPGGINPAKMRGMMKKMGISQTQLPVRKVVFEMDDVNLVIENPSVTRIMMQGQESFQVIGESIEESAESFNNEDVDMVIKQTNMDKNEVIQALKDSGGDIAEAIIKLRK